LCEWVARDLEDELQMEGDEAKVCYRVPPYVFDGAELMESSGMEFHMLNFFVLLEEAKYSTDVEFFVARGDSFVIISMLMNLSGSRLAESKIISGRTISTYADDEMMRQRNPR
jgi:hypothetical protein